MTHPLTCEMTSLDCPSTAVLEEIISVLNHFITIQFQVVWEKQQEVEKSIHARSIMWFFRMMGKNIFRDNGTMFF